MRLLLLSLAIIPTAIQSGIVVEYSCKIPASYKSLEDLVQEKCLATMIYGEARGEAVEGQVAVAYTAMNRAAKKTVCKVVLAPKQYSIFNNNPTLKAAAMSADLEPRQKNKIDKESWDRAVLVAQVVFRRVAEDPTKGATHYLADKVMKQKGYAYPRWSKVFQQVAVIDNHRFFKEKDKS